MTRYEGSRTPNGAQVTRKDEARGAEQDLALRLDLCNHSPTGFEWGYVGSGPAQLSLALLADALGDDERAVSLHQPFKREVVARLPARENWTLTDEEIRAIAERIERGNETGRDKG